MLYLAASPYQIDRIYQTVGPFPGEGHVESWSYVEAIPRIQSM